MLGRKYWVCVAITIVATCVVLVYGLGWSAAVGCVLQGILTSASGIAIGTGLFRRTRRRLGRVVPGMLSGLVSAIAGVPMSIAVALIWDVSVFTPHPSEYGGDTVYIILALYTIAIMGITGLVFGTGPGLPADGPYPGDPSSA